ncbi:MAG TPA: hypothetical protein VEJ44_01810 [Acidimicrobiales bacterium]|nr:hypothetical protein [Acidimicrobiales bacterium]
MATRRTLHKVAAHVLGRRRFEVSGRFGLRVSPGGFTTPAFGEGPEALRVADGILVRDRGASTAALSVAGSTLRQLAEFAGTDVDRPFSTGEETPEPGDVDTPLYLDPPSADIVAAWLATGARVLDRTLAALPDGAGAATVQLWPEHFDLGTNVVARAGGRVNLGASPGDDAIDEPYLYVGPWEPERPGDAAYWNAPFGAVLRRSGAGDGDDAVEAGVAFIRVGLDRLAGRPGA